MTVTRNTNMAAVPQESLAVTKQLDPSCSPHDLYSRNDSCFNIDLMVHPECPCDTL